MSNPTLLEALNKIQLSSFEQLKGKLGEKFYLIEKISSAPAPANFSIIGAWQHLIADNVAQLERSMAAHDLQTCDVQSTVPEAGMQYTIRVTVSNGKPVQVANGAKTAG